jgi:uncharacterized repeat protein (TIGR04076 family)
MSEKEKKPEEEKRPKGSMFFSPEERPLAYTRHPEVPFYKVRVTVAKAHPECGAKHKVGDTYEIWNVRRDTQKGWICPTAWASLFPFIYAMRYGAVFPWGEGPDINGFELCCPDIHTPVHFKIERVAE